MAFFTFTIISDMGFMSGSDALASSAFQEIGRTGSARSDTTEDAQERLYRGLRWNTLPAVPQLFLYMRCQD